MEKDWMWTDSAVPRITKYTATGRFNQRSTEHRKQDRNSNNVYSDNQKRIDTKDFYDALHSFVRLPLFNNKTPMLYIVIQ